MWAVECCVGAVADGALGDDASDVSLHAAPPVIEHEQV